MKLKKLILLMILTFSVGVVSNTYSKYVANATGNIDVMFANWQILLNNTDITNKNTTTATFEPTILPNTNVADNTFAPASQGYFDIEIDPTNVDVSFAYTIELALDNTLMPDIKMTEYAVIPDNYVEGESTLTYTKLDSTIITDQKHFDKTQKGFQFKPFVVRVKFQWYEGEGEAMDDEADTTLAKEKESVEITANVKFNQII